MKLFISAVACALLLVAGQPGTAETHAPRGPVEIVYWTGWSGHELEIQRGLIEKFEKANPNIKVRIMTVAGSYEKVTISLAAGNPPDLMSAVWLEELASYAMRGALRPLDDYAKASGRNYQEEYIPGLGPAIEYNGHIWGLMVSTASQFTMGNSKVYREAGLDPAKPPLTLDELDAANAKMAKFDASGNLVRFGWRPNTLLLTAHVFGGEWYDSKTGKVTANHPKNVEALRYMASYAKKYDARKLMAFEDMLSGANLGYVSDIGNFAGLFNGHAGLLFTGDWAQEFIDRFAPKDFEYFYFPHPAPKGGRENAFMIGGSCFVIPRDARHPDEAWQFLNYMTSPEAVKEFCIGIRNMPPLRSLLNDEEFTSTPLQRFAGKLLMGENVFSPAGMPIWAYYNSELMRVQGAAFLGGEDPQVLLDNVQKDVEAKLKEALKYAVY